MRFLAIAIFLVVNAVAFNALYDGAHFNFPSALLLFFLSSFGATLIHELAHAWMARRLGAEVQQISVWMFSLRMHPRKLRIVAPRRGGDVAGFVVYAFAGWWGRQRFEAYIAAAGPVANLAVALVAGLVATLLGRMGLHLAELALAPLVLVSGGMAVANLLPFKGSDGSVILQTIRAQRRRRS